MNCFLNSIYNWKCFSPSRSFYSPLGGIPLRVGDFPSKKNPFSSLSEAKQFASSPKLSLRSCWGGGIRTPDAQDQNLLPYRLATPQYCENLIFILSLPLSPVRIVSQPASLREALLAGEYRNPKRSDK
jgi:hypothetical protein